MENANTKQSNFKLLALTIFYVMVIFLCNMSVNAKPMIIAGVGIYLANLTFPVVWILKDTLQKNYGKKTIQQIIAINVLVNAFIYLWCLLANATAPDALYGYISGSVLLFVCSMVGFFVNENIDAIVYSWVNGSHEKKSLISNLCSVPVDTLITCVGLKLVGLTWPLVITSAIVQLAFKLTLPAIFYLVAKLRRWV